MTPSDKTNQYALCALRERRATIAGEITHLERRLRYLRQAITHLDGALTIMAPGVDPKAIKAKPYRRVKLFGAGKLNRLILGVLRKAERPMKTLEVVDALVAEMNFGPDAAAGMKGRVRANLLYLAKVRGLVTKDGERASATWTIAA